ncbi:hypothetical protein SLH49_07250 [Cognatiyoonia sp. IB215446]|uniref:hypothetical protein n=1 Tax=Cognatiyoonia sp. IB215446 TaxID=3097355 RepID=UPI002A0D3395|nr:hypothetical protein [Cognatiyoonia sp. IB215446]MDX8347779.1 hypothetical protein [Cognatiyoonia sp. IB215446]
MNTPTKPPVFLERASYRQRRLTDAVRLLPVLGLVLWGIPLLWGAEGAGPKSNAGALLYVFGVWVALIALTALIVPRLRGENAAPPVEDPE